MYNRHRYHPHSLLRAKLRAGSGFMALAGGAKTRTLFDSKGTARRRIRGSSYIARPSLYNRQEQPSQKLPACAPHRLIAPCRICFLDDVWDRRGPPTQHYPDEKGVAESIRGEQDLRDILFGVCRTSERFRNCRALFKNIDTCEHHIRILEHLPEQVHPTK